jgi:hypothetical protein
MVMKNEEAKQAATRLLSQYLQGLISVKYMLQQWPSASDPLLDDIYNFIIENVNNQYADADIARLALTALDSGASVEEFDRSLDMLCVTRRSGLQTRFRGLLRVRNVLRRLFGK